LFSHDDTCAARARLLVAGQGTLHYFLSSKDMGICGQPNFMGQSESPVGWLFFLSCPDTGCPMGHLRSPVVELTDAGCLTLLFMPLFTKVGHNGFSLKKDFLSFKSKKKNIKQPAT
jgi:hypothetical protein